MATETFHAKAKKHWAEWLPERSEDLKAQGIWQSETRTAAINAQDRMMELIQQGYQPHEAEEVALKEFILLPPEPDAAVPPDQAAELRAMEREYQEMMRGWDQADWDEEE